MTTRFGVATRINGGKNLYFESLDAAKRFAESFTGECVVFETPEEAVDTPEPANRITPSNAGVKPINPNKVSVVAKKRAFVPPLHLTHRPFEELRVLLTPVR